MTFSFFEFDLTNDAKCGEVFKAKPLNLGCIFAATANGNARFLIAADNFVASERFEGEKNGITKSHKFLPFWLFDRRVGFRQGGQVNAFDILRFVLNRSPAFLGGMNEDGSK